MANPFTARKPWAAALISFVFSPVAGMLYLNRGAEAVGYLAALIAAVIAVPLFWGAGQADAIHDRLFWVGLFVTLAGMAHAVVLARRWDANQPLKWYARWYSAVGIFGGLSLLALVVRTFFYQPFYLPSASMEPTIAVGDYFFVSKFAYVAQPAARGDVVVFHAKGGQAWVKRIVGMPGERIQMRGGQLFIDGVAVPQRYVRDLTETDELGTVEHPRLMDEILPGGRHDRVLDRGETLYDNTEVFTVPADAYFVLGDNRDNSNDSRGDFGFVPRNQIVGRAAYKFLSGGHWTWSPVE